MRWIYSLLMMIVFLSSANGDNMTQINYLPPGGVVSNEKMAAAIAEIVLSSVYGQAEIKKELPLKVHLDNDEVWMISGTFNEPKGTLGGVAQILIRKRDGAVLGMIHGE